MMADLAQDGTCSNLMHVCLKQERRVRESNKCNGVEHVPTCSTWPPAWIADGVAAGPDAEETGPQFPSDLDPDWLDQWRERVAIRVADGGLAVEDAEVAAMADVRRMMGFKVEALNN